jgi:hypothetical protein
MQTSSGLAIVRSDGTSREAPIATGTPLASGGFVLVT